MIRTTISKIKRVCAVALVPNILKGDIRTITTKFEKYTTAKSNSAHKSTKANDDAVKELEEGGSKSAAALVCEEVFKESSEDVLENDIILSRSTTFFPPLFKSSSACRCTDCRTIIAEIFGEDPTTDHCVDNTRESVSDVAIHPSETRQKESTAQALSDDRHDTFAFNLNHIKGDDNIRTVLFHEVILMKRDLAHKQESKPLRMQSKMAHSGVYDGESEIPGQTPKTEDDEYWNIVYETAIGENAVYFEPNMNIDLDTLNVYRTLKGKNTSYDDTATGQTKETFLDGLDKLLYGNPFEVAVLESTTNKQDEEKLDQRIEQIEETPLVEAENAKVEGFNVTPRVLGRLETDTDVHFDKIAEQCLNSPQDKLDEMLLKEMEKLGIPMSGQKRPIQKPLPNKEIDLENNEPVREPIVSSQNNSEIPDKHTLTNLDKQYLYDLERTKISDNPKEKATVHLDSNRTSNVQIDAKSRKVEWPNFGSKNDKMPSILPTRLGERNPPGVGQEAIKEPTQKPVFLQDHLNPRHVLTCNETCAINPNPILDNNRIQNLELNQTAYDGLFVNEAQRENTTGRTHIEDTRTPILEDGSVSRVERKVISKYGIGDTNNFSPEDTRRLEAVSVEEHSTTVLAKETPPVNTENTNSTSKTGKLATDQLVSTVTSKKGTEHEKSSASRGRASSPGKPDKRDSEKERDHERSAVTAEKSHSTNVNDNIELKKSAENVVSATSAKKISDQVNSAQTSAKATEKAAVRAIMTNLASTTDTIDITRPAKQVPEKENIVSVSESKELKQAAEENRSQMVTENLTESSKIESSAIASEKKDTVTIREDIDPQKETIKDNLVEPAKMDVLTIKAEKADAEKAPIQKESQAVTEKLSSQETEKKDEPITYEKKDLEQEKSPEKERVLQQLFNKADPQEVRQEDTINWTIKPEKEGESKLATPLANILAEARYDFREPSITEEIEGAVEILQATTQKLMETSHKMGSTTEKLQATCEKLISTSELLQYANRQMLMASNKLISQTEMLESNRIDLTTVAKASDSKDVDKNHKCEGKERKGDEEEEEKEEEQEKTGKSAWDKLSHSGGVVTSAKPRAVDCAYFESPLVPLPEITDQIKLSDLMRVVRERNRLMNCPECGKHRPCPPPLLRPHRPPSTNYPNTGCPQVGPTPRVCSPRKPKPHKPKELKCSRYDPSLGLDRSGPTMIDEPGFVVPIIPDDISQCEIQGIALPPDMSPADNLITQITRQLQALVETVRSVFQEVKIEALEAAMLGKLRHRSKLYRPKDYEPWTPIPSWPYPKVYKRPKLQCPKDGCKVPPPQASFKLPCGLKACESFPTFPRRTFCVKDYYTVSLSDHHLVDIGDF